MTETAELYKGQGSISTMVIGESGRGKSTAIRNMPPESTFIINVMGKPLPFPGAFQKFKYGENMAKVKEGPFITEKMREVSEMKHIQHLIIDDTQYIMASEFMDKVLIKGYDKFSIMAKNIWDIITTSSLLRDGLKVYILCHEESITEGGLTVRQMKTLGKLLREKISPEGLNTIVLFSEVSMSDKGPTYFFRTQSDGITTAKAPMGMFPLDIPNDLWLVSQRIDEYYSGVALEKSKLDMTVRRK